MARLALRAQLDFDSDVKSQLCGPLLSQPVGVEVMSLVTGRKRERETGRGGGDRMKTSKLKDFKAFKKV